MAVVVKALIGCTFLGAGYFSLRDGFTLNVPKDYVAVIYNRWTEKVEEPIFLEGSYSKNPIYQTPYFISLKPYEIKVTDVATTKDRVTVELKYEGEFTIDKSRVRTLIRKYGLKFE